MKKPCSDCVFQYTGKISLGEDKYRTIHYCKVSECQQEEEMKKYNEYLESKRKYTKGEQIISIDELMNQEFIYLYHKIYHKGWFQSWQLRSAKNYVDRGIYKAVLK